MTPMYLAELFDINVDQIPRLYSYALNIRGSTEPVKLGRKLANRLSRLKGGHWVWTSNLLVTDLNLSHDDINNSVRELRKVDVDSFKDLISVEIVTIWEPASQALAEFVAQGLVPDFNNEIQTALPQPIDLNGIARVERECETRGWAVNDQPVISISIDSRVIFRDDLKTYIKRVDSVDSIVGLSVFDKVRYENGGIPKGEVIAVLGKLDVNVDRQHLLDIAQRQGSKDFIQKAENGEYVVSVGNSEIAYVVSELGIIVYPKYYKRFKIDSQAALNATLISPDNRALLVKQVSSILKRNNLIKESYSSNNKNAKFIRPKSYYYDSRIMLGGGTIVDYKNGGNALLQAISRAGFYRRVSKEGDLNTPLNIGIINASQSSLQEAQNALQQQLAQLGLVRATFQSLQIQDTSRLDFEIAIKELLNFSPHIILAIIPEVESKDEDDWGPYYDFKSLMMQTGIPSQVLDSDTIRKTRNLSYVMQNVAFGMASKMGNIPYILANALDYADMVVGIDIARKRNKSGSGSQNAAAIAQVYQQGGQFALCRVVETPLEGETVPAKVLRSFFPLNDFQNKRVIIHRDGPFRGNEIEIIEEYIKKLGGGSIFC